MIAPASRSLAAECTRAQQTADHACHWHHAVAWVALVATGSTPRVDVNDFWHEMKVSKIESRRSLMRNDGKCVA